MKITNGQGTDDWHRERSRRLTASNFSAAIGISQVMSRRKLWQQYRKIGPKFQGNDATNWGKTNEATAILAYERFTKQKAISTGLYAHDRYNWLGCSPDGLIDPDGGIEIKCPYYKKEPHLSIPSYYMPQIQGNIEIVGAEWWDFVSWCPTQLNIIRVYRSRAYWEWVLPLLDEFWEYVIEG